MRKLEHNQLLPDIEGQRVIAAMSGGVDSSVCALLLAKSGACVMGATMRLFDSDDLTTTTEDENYNTCCTLDDVEDAKDICRRLGIRHHTLDFSQDFSKKVMDPFCQKYLNGETPNPCIECNRYLKFDTLQRFRIQMGYDFIATGHYVRRMFNPQSGRYELRVAMDPTKDQSYVLYSLTQEQLKHTLFPLGELSKSQVREIAASEGFVNAQKPESQDICFVPDGNYVSFIEKRTGKTIKPGPIIDTSGRILGEHTGLASYTIGQRKGIGVAGPEPLYVCGKNLELNQLIVGPREDTFITRVMVDKVNFVSVDGLAKPIEAQAKIRYRQKAQAATVVQTGPTSLEIAFHEPICATAPGQAAVIYDEDLVLAGGTISSCQSN